MAMKPRTGEVPAQAPLDQPLFVDDAPTEPILRAPNPLQESVRFVNTDLEKAIDNRLLENMSEDGDLGIPDRIPQHVIDNPDAGGARELPDKKPSWIKRGIAATVAVGAVGAAAYGIGYLKTKGEVDALNDARGGDVTTSAPAAPGYEGVPDTTEQAPLDMFNTDITHEDYGRQLEVTIPYLEERRAQSMQEAVAERELQNKTHFTDPSEFAGNPALMQAQQDQNDISADLWTISKESNLTLARNLLNSVFWNNPENGNDAFDNNVKLLGDGKKFLVLNYVFEVSPTYTRGTLGNAQTEGQPTYLAQVNNYTDKDSIPLYDVVIGNRTSQSGKYSKKVVLNTIKPDSSVWVDSPSQIPPQS